MTTREQHWTVNGDTFNVRLEEVPAGGLLEINGAKTKFQVVERSANGLVIEIDGEVHRLFFRTRPKRVHRVVARQDLSIGSGDTTRIRPHRSAHGGRRYPRPNAGQDSSS